MVGTVTHIVAPGHADERSATARGCLGYGQPLQHRDRVRGAAVAHQGCSAPFNADERDLGRPGDGRTPWRSPTRGSMRPRGHPGHGQRHAASWRVATDALGAAQASPAQAAIPSCRGSAGSVTMTVRASVLHRCWPRADTPVKQ